MTQGSDVQFVFGHLRVVELAEDPAGEMVGKYMAQMGAEVIKVEPPGGSPTRKIGPFAHGRNDGDHSLTFWYYNTNKHSVVIDYATAAGRLALMDLLQDADACVTTLSPKVAKELELEATDLLAVSKGLIVVSITPYGLDGPFADWKTSDLLALADGGTLITCGYDDHTIPPIRPGGNQGYHQAASFGQVGLLLALLEREQTGEGQIVDVAMHDCLAVGNEMTNPFWLYGKTLMHRQTCRYAQPSPTEPNLFRCADGGYIYFLLFNLVFAGWKNLVDWLDSHGAAADLIGEEYADVQYLQTRLKHVEDVLEAFFLTQDAEAAYLDGQSCGVAVGVVRPPDSLLTDEHLAARGFFTTVEHDDVEPALYPGSPVRFSSIKTLTSTRRAPTLGEHTQEVVGHHAPIEEKSTT